MAGLGQGLVRRFANEGMRVAILDVDHVAAETVAGDLRSEGFDAVSCEVDVTDEHSVRPRPIGSVRYGACNVLCAHVGGGGTGRLREHHDRRVARCA